MLLMNVIVNRTNIELQSRFCCKDLTSKPITLSLLITYYSGLIRNKQHLVNVAYAICL